MIAATMSYVSGASDKPLLGMTIGDMFDQTAALTAAQWWR